LGYDKEGVEEEGGRGEGGGEYKERKIIKTI